MNLLAVSCVRNFRSGVFALILGVLAVPFAAAGATYDYEAVTAAKARKQGAVKAGSIEWQCKGSSCRVSGPWPTPGVSACGVLARLVGPIRSYGHAKKKLSAAELQRCNAGLATAASDPSAPKTANVGGIAATAPTVQSSARDKASQLTGRSPATDPGLSSGRAIEREALEEREDPRDQPGVDISVHAILVYLSRREGRQRIPGYEHNVMIQNERNARYDLGGYLDVVLYQGTPESGLRWVDSNSTSIPPIDLRKSMRDGMGRPELRNGVWYTLRAQIRNNGADVDRSNDCMEYRFYMDDSGNATSGRNARFDCAGVRIDTARPG